MGRGEADIECGFDLAAELDHVEGIASKITDKGCVETHLCRRKVEVPRDDGLDPTLD